MTKIYILLYKYGFLSKNGLVLTGRDRQTKTNRFGTTESTEEFSVFSKKPDRLNPQLEQ
jgi:hypothetical protein